MSACPFCDYAGPSEVLFEYDGVFIIEPINPVVPGHVLVIPREHVEDALADPEVAGRVMEAAAWFAHGDCNIITSVGTAATQTVKHLHLHIVPRADGDGLVLPWTPRVTVGITCGRDPNEVEALLRERDRGETVCPDDGLPPGQHGWSDEQPVKVTPELRDHLRRIGVKEHALPEVEADPWQVIDWLAVNMPRALELCPYKVKR